MKKRWLCLLLLMALLVSCSKTQPNPEITDPVTTEQTSEPLPPANGPLEIVSGGKSTFAIIVDVTDPLANEFARTIQTLITKTVGVPMPKRSVSELSNYEKRILIGTTADAASVELKNKTKENGYSAKVSENTLALYADSPEGYLRLETFLKDTLLKDAQKGSWSLDGSLTSFYDPMEHMQEMIFKKDQKTVYHIIGNPEKSDEWLIASRIANYLTKTAGIKAVAVADTGKFENEIIIGEVNRPIVKNMMRYLKENGSYYYGVYDGAFVIESTDKFGYVMGVTKLAALINAQDSDTVTLSSLQNLKGNLSDLPKDDLYVDTVTLAKTLFGTYSSWVERQFSKMSDSDRQDQFLIEALKDRMGNSLVMSVGSSSALHNGFVIKLDTVDYGKVTRKNAAGHILAAADYLSRYFETELTGDSEGYVDVTDLCSQNPDYTLEYFEEFQIAIVRPKTVESFADLNQKISGYTNRQYLVRMDQFFHNPKLPEPDVNVEQSRIEILSKTPDPKYIYDYTLIDYECYASPSILHVDGVIYVAYDLSVMTMRNHHNTSDRADSYLLRSKDGGKTWEQIGEMIDFTYGALLELDGKIYVLGMRRSDAMVAIAAFDPADDSFRYSNLGFNVMGTAPTAVAIYNGRVWRAHNNGVISASVNSDLLLGENWISSESPNEVFFQSDYERLTGLNVTGKFWLEEGNMIVGRDGKLYAMYRIDASPTYDYAEIFEVSEDGRHLIPVEKTGVVGKGLIHFPSGQSKFMVKYDEKTGLYLTMTSIVTNGSPHQRNVLALVASEDLIHWKEVGVLLVEREMINHKLSEYAHAFQYVDFDFIGDDIYMVIRESYGTACNYHNANSLTVYRLENYQEYITSHWK